MKYDVNADIYEGPLPLLVELAKFNLIDIFIIKLVDLTGQYLARIKMTDPGHPQTCNVCGYWKMFAPDRYTRVWEECATAKRGCVQNKRELAEVLVRVTEPFRAIRTASAAKDRGVRRILDEGAERAREAARRTMDQVKQAVGLSAS